jgi:alkanesulfonate monooxygenase SsuD/methylene tetrahydromethanopterin reductase-like flavin-dependent oxidoreductase (luciferase family)
MLTPPSRRRPWNLARQTTTVDRLSGGRLILPVGLGAADDRGVVALGEEADRKIRAERTDEALDILVGLWSGEPFGFRGKHYQFAPMAFRPTPVQARIPIWVVGAWPSERSMTRVLRYDGLLPYWLPQRGTEGLARPQEPEQLAEMRNWISARRSLEGFDIIMEGTTSADDAAAAAAEAKRWADAGATWWIESDWSNWDVAVMRRRIAAGPPRAEAAASIRADG